MTYNVVCVKCCRAFVPDTIGVYLVERLKDGSVYRIWHADVSICPVCGTKIIYQLGDKPLAQKFDKELMETAQHLIAEAMKITKLDNVCRVYYWNEA